MFFLAAFGTLIGVLFYDKITDWMSERATDVTSKSMEDPQFIDDATVFGTYVGKQIIVNLSKDEEVKNIFGEFFKDLFTSEPIVSAARNLSNDVVHAVVVESEHEQIRSEATELAKKRIIKVFQDPETQEAVNVLVWKTINDSVLPAILPWPWGGKKKEND